MATVQQAVAPIALHVGAVLVAIVAMATAAMDYLSLIHRLTHGLWVAAEAVVQGAPAGLDGRQRAHL